MDEESTPKLHHWLNTIVGQIDAAFSLTQEELYATTKIVNGLLLNLHLDTRENPAVLPTPLIAEMNSSYWAVQLHAADRLGPHAATPRHIGDGETAVSIDAWRNALAEQIFDSYPCISPIERIVTAKTLDSLLEAIGVQFRAPKYIPEAAVTHHRDERGQ